MTSESRSQKLPRTWPPPNRSARLCTALPIIQEPINLAAPELFGLSGITAGAFRVWGASQALVNPLTEHGLAVKPVSPLHVHGGIEKWMGAAMLTAVALLGGLRERRNRNFILGYAALDFLIYNLTD